jgi:DNA-binding NtrC family response regulator
MPSSPTVKQILLLEKDVAMRQQVQDLLVAAGYRVTASGHATGVGEQLASGRYDALVASLDSVESGDPRKLQRLKRQAGGAPILLLCPAERIETGATALRHGADDYLLRPPHPAELDIRLTRLLERQELDSQIEFFRDELSKRAATTSVESRSPAMHAVLERISRVAPMRSTVLINGESGVGKELVARSIHFNSPRRNRPFIALNCAAIPSSLIESELFGHEKGAFTGAHGRSRGKFEIAHRGTLFLDEIAEMAPATQAKLLRVLEEREFMRVGGDQQIRVDVRVIAATNADMGEMVGQMTFRRDLYYRLKVVTIDVPPLRERRADIPSLVQTFLDELARANAVERKTITPAALHALEGYRWPGNVRELKNLIESLLVSVPGGVIGVQDLPSYVQQVDREASTGGFPAGTRLEEMERELIRRTLESTGGNRTHSASLLGIGVRTLQRKIQAYDIRIAPKRRRSRQPKHD